MKVNKYKVLAALVRSFFDAFSSGVVDSGSSDAAESRKPKHFKEAMLNHYGDIAPVFFDTMFFPLAAMNFSYADIERVVREAQGRGDDMMALVKTACASDALYEAMAAEYRRNFTSLLGGCCTGIADHLAAYTRPPQDAGVECLDADRAIELVVRVVMFGYARGLRQASQPSAAKPSLRQSTLFRLLLDAMNVLLLDEAADFAACGENLSEMFLKVCVTEHNFTVMTSEMDRTFDELVRKEGIGGNAE